jgi:hypothetical protein
MDYPDGQFTEAQRQELRSLLQMQHGHFFHCTRRNLLGGIKASGIDIVHSKPEKRVSAAPPVMRFCTRNELTRQRRIWFTTSSARIAPSPSRRTIPERRPP